MRQDKQGLGPFLSLHEGAAGGGAQGLLGQVSLTVSWSLLSCPSQGKAMALNSQAGWAPSYLDFPVTSLGSANSCCLQVFQQWASWTSNGLPHVLPAM